MMEMFAINLEGLCFWFPFKFEFACIIRGDFNLKYMCSYVFHARVVRNNLADLIMFLDVLLMVMSM